LQHNRVPAPEMFFDLYARNPIDRVFRFLDGESTFMEEVTLMRSMAVKPFAQAALDVVRKRIGF
jgi:lycopene beta-cyclase